MPFTYSFASLSKSEHIPLLSRFISIHLAVGVLGAGLGTRDRVRVCGFHPAYVVAFSWLCAAEKGYRG